MPRHSLSDEQWARIEPLLPPEKPLTGRPSISHRRFFNAILWLVRTGAPWRDLPAEHGAVEDDRHSILSMAAQRNVVEGFQSSAGSS
jgi:transposase